MIDPAREPGDGPEVASDRACADALERFAVHEATERARWLQALRDAQVPITLGFESGNAAVVAARVLAVDVTRGTVDLDTSGDRAALDALRAVQTVTAVAAIDGVMLRFELGAGWPVPDSDLARLRAPIPTTMHRLQRRDAFRVAPPAQASARLFVQIDGVERALHVVDVSATGIAFEWADGAVPPPPGERLERARLELPATLPLHPALRVRSVATACDEGATGPRRHRVGCAFERLDPAAARAVQVFVNVAQTRGRRVRPGPR